MSLQKVVWTFLCLDGGDCQIVCVAGVEINMTVMREDMTIWMDRSLARPSQALQA